MTTRRIESVDVLRGLALALMVLVNSPGSWGARYAQLRHAAWNGFTLADIVFPLFLFVMGVSMYLSLSKSGFRLSWKILRRTLLLIGLGLVLNYCGQWPNGDFSLSHLRYTGILQRFGLCFGLAAVLVCTLNHKWLPWVILLILGGYTALLLLGNGYVRGPENILSRTDIGLFGETHIYDDHKVDPEGLLSSIPGIAHTLIGFLVGGWVKRKEYRKVAGGGVLLVTAGVLLSALWLPLNKKIWSPSFVLFTCGIGALLLALLYLLVDWKQWRKHDGFFKAFGTNAIYCYVTSHVFAWLSYGTGFHAWYGNLIGDSPFLSLMYALGIVGLTWLTVLPLYRRKIFLRL